MATTTGSSWDWRSIQVRTTSNVRYRRASGESSASLAAASGSRASPSIAPRYGYSSELRSAKSRSMPRRSVTRTRSSGSSSETPNQSRRRSRNGQYGSDSPHETHPPSSHARGGPDQHVARLGRALEPGRRVDGVSHGTVFDPAASPHHPEDGRARRDADADAEPLDAPSCGDLSRVFADVLGDPEAGQDRPLGVVLVRSGSAEQGEDAVSRQVLDGAAKRLDRRHDPGHGLAHDELDLLGIEAVPQGGRPHEVGKPRRDDLSFLPHGRCLGPVHGPIVAGSGLEEEAPPPPIRAE